MLNAGYFRHPTIAGDTILFVSEDDLWSVPADGGIARRLTAAPGDVSNPVLSRDGALVAFTARIEAHPEVWVMPADGGEARRLTFLGATAQAKGWTPDGRILFASDAGYAFAPSVQLFTVSPDGGEPERLPYGLANDAAFGPNGGMVIGRWTMDPATWKRYRGGRTGKLWVDASGSGRFKRLLPDVNGNLASPMWIGGRIYFLSDHEGVGNLYSCLPTGRDLRRHTDHDTYYARLAQTDGARIVYQHAAELWVFDPASDEHRRVDVGFHSPRAQRARRFVPSADFLNGYDVHPGGHSLAVTTRGKAFTMPLWEEAPRQYGEADGVRYRHLQWLPDGERLVAVSDASGEEGIEVFKPGSAEPLQRFDGPFGRVVEMVASPAADVVAMTTHRLELLLLDLATGAWRVVDRGEHGQIVHPAWSPDGTWLAYSFAETRQTRSIKLCEAATGATHLVTRPEFRDVAPAWDPEGRFLYFLSMRWFDPVYDTLFFDLGFPRSMRPHLVTLRRDVASPFVPRPKGFGEQPPAPDAKAKKKPEGPQRIEIDLDGIEDRVLSFPVPEGRYGQIHGLKGKAIFTWFPVQGSLGSDWSDDDQTPRGALQVYDFGEQKHDTLVRGINDFSVSRDGATLVYRQARRLRAVKAGDKPDEKTEKDAPGRRSGWIDLNRIKVSVSPPQEWRQMYREAWRLQRENFWVETMSGVDWDGVYERYLPVLDKVGSRLEFSDLIWEMQGELGTSHAYEMGGDHRQPPPYTMGLLGADLRLDAKSGLYRIEHIVRGDVWDPRTSSPLAQPGLGVSEGDTLLAVGGRAVGRGCSPAELLVNQAGNTVELTVGDAKGKNARTISVTTLRTDTPARYREWVEANRRTVHERTGGRVGYVHIPDMGANGYAEFHRSYLAEVERDALIVDVRFNRGGHVSELLLEKLGRKRIGYGVPRWGTPEPYPNDSVLGPMVAITNERAGSDGDIFTHGFKLMNLGTVVGMRTWGGVIGISPRHRLVDGGVTTQPEFSFWFEDVGWGVENYGTDPHVEVDIAPHDYAAGNDPQLEKALSLVLQALRREKPAVPAFDGHPNLAPSPLPPRGTAASSNGKRRTPARAPGNGKAAGNGERSKARRAANGNGATRQRGSAGRATRRS